LSRTINLQAQEVGRLADTHMLSCSQTHTYTHTPLHTPLHTHTHTHIHGHIHAHTGAVNAGTELFEKKSGSATPSSGRQRRLSQRLLSLLGHGESFHVNRSQSSICDLISEEEIAGSKPAGRFGTKA